jgi:hypothetical protein
MAMSKRHFVALAEAVRSTPMSPAARATLAARLSATLADFNPRFDRDRFVGACQPAPALRDAGHYDDAGNLVCADKPAPAKRTRRKVGSV